MPDISMCPGTGCPDKKKCYRFMAVPNTPRQDYCDFGRITEGYGKPCEYFIKYETPNKTTKVQRRLRGVQVPAKRRGRRADNK